uniref:Uncharacterized protein n=1 Tax=Aegilops tauschii TaxID=37682 RepID=M8BVP4_AEGTA
MPIEACCAVAVGTVGRPSCYCLVKEEAAFGMSPLFNISNMAQLLARCGASIYLNKALDNPCDRSYDEKETAECTSPQMTPKTDSCKTAKVSDSEDGEDAVSHTSQDLILEGKRNRNANPSSTNCATTASGFINSTTAAARMAPIS